MSPSPERMSLPVMAGAVTAMFLWALCFPLISLGLDAAPPMAYAALRAVVSGLVLLALARLLRRPRLTGARVRMGVAGVGLSATALGFVGMFYGGGLVSPGIATVVANTQPLIAAGLAWSVLDESLRPVQRVGLAAGFGGIVLIGVPGMTGGGGEALGVLYILAGAVGVAVGNVLLKRLAGRVDVLRAMGWQFLVGALPLGAWALLAEDVTAIRWSPGFLLSLGVLSLFGTAAVFVLWFTLLERARLTQLNVFTFLTPVFGLAMGTAFFAETIELAAIVGIGLSLIGIYLVTRPPVAAAGSSRS